MNARTTLLSFVLSAVVGTAQAGPVKPFTQQEFDALNQAGQSSVVDVAATWCPTCKAQKPLIEELAKEPAYAAVTVLVVDYDTGKAALKQFGVGMQSTLLAFNRGKEVARTVGDTSRAGIERLFRQAAGN